MTAKSRGPEVTWTGSHVDRKPRGPEATWTGSHVDRKPLIHQINDIVYVKTEFRFGILDFKNI